MKHQDLEQLLVDEACQGNPVSVLLLGKPGVGKTELISQLIDLVSKVEEDLNPKYNPMAERGYAILTYQDQGLLRTILLEVPKA